jgi:hypothetical protein
METEDSYAFPLYHRLGRAVRPIISSRYWIVIVLIVAILLYTPFLFSGFFQDDYGFRLQFSPEVYAEHDLPEEVMRTMRNSPLNLYGFSWDASARFRFGQDKGFAVGLGRIKTNFPALSSLTGPGLHLCRIRPADAHPAVVVLPADPSGLPVVSKQSGSAVVAGISILLFVVDDVFTGPAGWISNRHAVLAMVFSVLCVWLYHQGVSELRAACMRWPCLHLRWGWSPLPTSSLICWCWTATNARVGSNESPHSS